MLPISVCRGNGVPLAPRAYASQSHAERLQGWLGKDALEAGSGLLLRPCTSVHTFHMKFSLDVAFLDLDGRVLKVVQGLRPNRVAFAPLGRLWRPWSCQALELPEGAAGGLAQGEALFIETRSA